MVTAVIWSHPFRWAPRTGRLRPTAPRPLGPRSGTRGIRRAGIGGWRAHGVRRREVVGSEIYGDGPGARNAGRTGCFHPPAAVAHVESSRRIATRSRVPSLKPHCASEPCGIDAGVPARRRCCRFWRVAIPGSVDGLRHDRSRNPARSGSAAPSAHRAHAPMRDPDSNRLMDRGRRSSSYPYRRAPRYRPPCRSSSGSNRYSGPAVPHSARLIPAAGSHGLSRPVPRLARGAADDSEEDWRGANRRSGLDPAEARGRRRRCTREG